MGAFFVVVGIFVVLALVRSVRKVGGPNELLVFSGYRGQNTVRGDTYWKMPVIEDQDRLDLTTMSIDIHIDGAYSKGGIPLNVHAIANVKISSDPDYRNNAVEQLLGNDVRRVAKEELEGRLRSVLAEMTPEEVNSDREKFTDQLTESIEGELKETLGLHIDTLKIQNVEDERDYLNSIGRERIAQIIKEAEVAESNARKAAEEAEAEARGRGEVARRNAQAEIQKAQNQLRELEAELDQKAESEEERANARALEAKAEAEQKLQQVRTELEKLRLQADVVIPAEAEKVAQELKAQGEAAEIAEQGRAMGQVLAMMADLWHEAGDAALDVFVMQRLESIMDKVSEAARQVEVREAAIIDSGGGDALPNYVSSFPKVVGSIFQEMEETVGLDINGALTGDKSNGSLDGEGARLFDEMANQIEEAADGGELDEQQARTLLDQLRTSDEAESPERDTPSSG
jgi:flotillin